MHSPPVLKDWGSLQRLLEEMQGTNPNTLILTSPVPRAYDSAMVLKEILNVPVKKHVVFQSDGGVEQAYTLIQEAETRARLIVAVTHLEHALALPRHVAKKDFGITLPRKTSVGNGQGTLLEYRSRTVKPLQPTVRRG